MKYRMSTSCDEVSTYQISNIEIAPRYFSLVHRRRIELDSHPISNPAINSTAAAVGLPSLGSDGELPRLLLLLLVALGFESNLAYKRRCSAYRIPVENT